MLSQSAVKFDGQETALEKGGKEGDLTLKPFATGDSAVSAPSGKPTDQSTLT
jgi:hypothetical protein